MDNGPSAEVTGAEVQLDWLPTDSLRLGASLAYYDTELKDDFCDFDQRRSATTVNAARRMRRLPLTPEFKGSLIGRYTFPTGGWESYVQGALSYQTSAPSTIYVADNAVLGDIPSSTFLDLAYGLGNDKYNFEIFLSNATDEDAPLSMASDCADLRGPALGRAAPAAHDRHPLLAGLLRRDGSETGRGATRRPFFFHTFESGNAALRRFM